MTTQIGSPNMHITLPAELRLSDYHGISVEGDRSNIAVSWVTAFAYVLNSPEAQVIEPGEAADFFFPELFAVAPDGRVPYVMDSYLHDHMRWEILRMCDWLGLSALQQMENEIALYCRANRYYGGSFDGASFAPKMCDGCEDEGDTLNSELLVTQEYVPPQDVPNAIGDRVYYLLDVSSELPGYVILPLEASPTEKGD